MLITHYSNQAETLVSELAGLLNAPGAAPLAPETIVVQGPAMARWLSLRLAERLGIAANMSFPLPAQFIWELFRAVSPSIPVQSAFTPETMTWRLMDLLPDAACGPGFGAVRRYLRGGGEQERFELAEQIAAVFDRYLVYRPDWILRWEAGHENHWQAALWRDLSAALGHEHWVKRQVTFDRSLDTAHGLPERVMLFGLPALSPGYLDVMARFADRSDVHLFLLNPCRQYWGDIVAPRDIERRDMEAPAEEIYLEIGHPLLSSLGRRARDFLDAVQQKGGQEVDHFVEPRPDSLLGQLQLDILDLRHRGTGDVPSRRVRAQDRSLQVHVCHSATREVEVLHDQLLRLFAEHPELAAAGVLVMVPDIAAYAPNIDAVFSAAEHRIPFVIADHGARAESRLTDTFFELLELGRGRYDVNDVLGLLDTPAIRRRFELPVEDLATVRSFVSEAGIRWAIDADQRVGLSLPATPEHSWRFGLERILLGYAMAPREDVLFAGRSPLAGVEGTEAEVMGRFACFAEAVLALPEQLAGTRSLHDWQVVLYDILSRYISTADDEEHALQSLRQAIATLEEEGERAGFTGTVPLEVVAKRLRTVVRDGGQGRFLGGGVNFTGVADSEGIPFDVICLLGMNDGAFPRLVRPVGFDLTARKPRRGDRSLRHDDRYRFLQSILSARRFLYLSYVGRDIRDNSVIPPSPLLSELFDVLDESFIAAGGESRVRERLIVEHPLQAFSRRYFDGGSNLFSHATELCDAVRAAALHPTTVRPLFMEPLPAAGEDWKTVSPEQLVSFFSNPSRYVLRERLGVRLNDDDGLLASREPFALDNFETQALREDLLVARRNGAGADRSLESLRAAGRLPHGRAGEVAFEDEGAVAESFASVLDAHAADAFLEPVEVVLASEPATLRGWLRNLTPKGLLRYRPGQTQAPDRIAIWVSHLCLNLVAPPGAERLSHWLSDDLQMTLRPVAEAERYLKVLLAIYRDGLHRPLPLPARSAWEYITQRQQDRDAALSKARTVWEGSNYKRGDREDVYHALAFRGVQPIGEEFAELAERVYGPLLDHCQDFTG